MRRVPPMGFFKAASSLDAYAAAVMADTPLAYWRCGEGSGTDMLDSSGNGLHGTYTAGTGLTEASMIAGRTALRCVPYAFGGHHGSLTDVPASLRFGHHQAFTLEAWMYSEDGSQAGSPISCRDYGADESVRRNGYSIKIPNDTNVMVAYYPAQSPEIGGYKATGFTNMWHRWVHLVATFSGTASATSLTIYVDSVSQNPLTGVGFEDASADPGYTGHINLGLFLNGDPGNTGYLNARVCEVAIYGTALSAERIAAHYAAAGL